jgi:hypothetical protein
MSRDIFFIFFNILQTIPPEGDQPGQRELPSREHAPAVVAARANSAEPDCGHGSSARSGQTRQLRAVERGHSAFGARHAQPEAVSQLANLRMVQQAEHGVTILLVRHCLVGDSLTHGGGIDNVSLLRHG